jgi:phage-related minor tail protein
MADRIKGITVEIGGDTVGLQKSLKAVNTTSRNLQSELKDVQKLLKFDPSNTELLAQKQELLNKTVENTSKKLDQLRAAEAQVQAQFEAGTIKEEQYRAFQRELAATESSLKSTQTAIRNMKEEQDRAASGMKELTNLFKATKTSVDDYADVLGTNLVNAIKEGTATSRQLDKAFSLIGKEALGSEGDIDKLRQSINKLETGEASIKKVRSEIKRLQSDAEEAKEATKQLGSELGGLAVGAAAGVGLSEIISTALEGADTKAIIDISFDVSDESKKAILEAKKSIEAYGIDGEAALSGLQKQWSLNKTLTDEQNAAIVQGAATISKAYADIDFNELIQENQEIALGFGIAHDQALGLVNELLKVGFPPDQLDIISEYGTQLIRAGYSAEEVQNIMAAGVETGTWNIDVLLDGLKEGRIRMAEFGGGIDKATLALIQRTDISANQLKTWGSAIAEGGEGGKAAMVEVAQALEGVDDATLRNQLGVKLFGTLYEENGSLITETLINAEKGTADLTKGTENLAGATKKIDASPQVKLNKALQEMKKELAPLLTSVAEFVGKVADWISKNPKLAATIGAIVTVIGLMVGILTALAPILLLINTGALTLAGTMAILTAPITLTIAAIAALIAIGVLVYKNWDTIVAKGKQFGAWMGKIFTAFVKTVSEKMSETLSTIKKVWSKVTAFFENIDLKQVGKDVINGLINGIKSMASKAYNAAKDLAKGVAKSIKDFLKIGSPSKVTEEYGESVDEGMAKGIINKKSTVTAAAKVAAAEAKKGFEAGLKAINYKIDTDQLNFEEAKKQLESLKAKYRTVPEAVQKVNKEIYDLTKKHNQDLVTLRKQQFDEEKGLVEKSKYYHTLSLTEELQMYENSIKKYKAGTEERIYYEREIYRVKNEINAKLHAINNDYLAKVEATNQRLLESEKAVTDEYNRAVSDRTKALYNFAGLFDKIALNSEVSGQDLIDNLKGQVDAFEDWQDDLDSLSARGVDQALIGELQEMGVKAGGEIAALNTLTDAELNQYVSLWKQKHQLATLEAESELTGMKASVQGKIQELRFATNQELSRYRDEWISKIAEIRTGTTDEFVHINASMKDIGLNAIQNLINGMKEMSAPLIEQAKSMAQAVGDAINSTLGLVNGISSQSPNVKPPNLKGTTLPNPNKFIIPTTTTQKALTVNISSPKALDVKEANREFNKSLNKMSLMW